QPAPVVGELGRSLEHAPESVGPAVLHVREGERSQRLPTRHLERGANAFLVECEKRAVRQEADPLKAGRQTQHFLPGRQIDREFEDVGSQPDRVAAVRAYPCEWFLVVGQREEGWWVLGPRELSVCVRRDRADRSHLSGFQVPHPELSRAAQKG